MMLNCTNHPYSIWSEPQRKAAVRYGEVIDLPFPSVDPLMKPEEPRRCVEIYAEQIPAMHPDVVLAAGEFTFLFMLVDKLLREGIRVVCACSERKTVEVRLPDGSNEKKSVFCFEAFRNYEYFDVRGGTEDGCEPAGT